MGQAAAAVVEQGGTAVGDGAPAGAPAPAPAGDGAAPAANGADPAGAPAPAGEPEGDKPGFWPDDWRQRVAGEDAAELKRLGRFDSPEALYKSNRELEKKLSSGQYVQKLGKDASEDEVAAWRKANGVPDDAAGYGIDVKDDPLMGDFLDHAAKSGLTPDAAKSAVEWYNQFAQNQEQAQAEADKKTRTATEEALREEWGGEFRGHMNALVNHLRLAIGDEQTQMLLKSRTPDGRLIGNDADIVRGLVRIALEMNPADTVVPGGGTPDSVETELARISNIQKTDENRYWKEGLDKRRLDLIKAQQRFAN